MGVLSIRAVQKECPYSNQKEKGSAMCGKVKDWIAGRCQGTQQDRAVNHFVSVLSLIAILVILTVLMSPAKETMPACTILGLVAVSAFVIGGLIGFLNTRLKNEDTPLGAYATIINTAITGSFLTDVLNADGYTRSFVKSLSTVTFGHDRGAPIIAIIMLAMVPLGFVVVYLYRVSQLNGELFKNYKAWNARDVFDTKAASFTELANREATRLKEDKTPSVPEGVKDEAKKLMAATPNPEELDGVDDAVVYAKCCCIAGESEKGLQVLKNRLITNPDNSTLLLSLGMIYLMYDGNCTRKERYERAEEYLLKHCADKAARIIALKGLGYCRIMLALCADRSEEEKAVLAGQAKKITESYIKLRKSYGGQQCIHPGDWVNLASAMALMKLPEEEILETINKAVDAGAAVEIVQRLQAPIAQDPLVEFDSLKEKILEKIKEHTSKPQSGVASPPEQDSVPRRGHKPPLKT